LGQLQTIALAAAAVLAAGTMGLGDSRADTSGTYYALSAPRIIVVPQPGDDPRRSQASLRSEEPERFDDDEADAAPRVVNPHSRAQRTIQPPAHRTAPSEPRARKAAAKESPPRRKPFNVSLPEPPPPEPEPRGPKRALLSAPPPPPTSSLHDGPTPLKPTPRFGQPLPEAPAPLTTFTPPAVPKPVIAATPTPLAAAPEPSTAAHPAVNDDDEDSLPPPGDPKLAPPEPRD